MNLEPELQALKDNLLEMMDLVTTQLVGCRKALAKADLDAAKEVIASEKRVNALELTIDKDCENILALYNPVATDLRFVLASLKIGNDLERIGDNAKVLAKFLSSGLQKKEIQLIGEFKLETMFNAAIEMLTHMSKAVKDKDTQLAMKVLKMDAILNEHGKNASKTAVALIGSNPDHVKIILRLFAITRRMERVGDLIKNIGEEVVFHVEAKVIKHKKKDKDKKKD